MALLFVTLSNAKSLTAWAEMLRSAQHDNLWKTYVKLYQIAVEEDATPDALDARLLAFLAVVQVTGAHPLVAAFTVAYFTRATRAAQPGSGFTRALTACGVE